MRGLKCGLLIVALAATVVSSASAGATARSSALAIKPVVFTDASGDSGSAADIASVSVTNDQAGVYTVDITFATSYVNPDYAVIFFDTDANVNTGSSGSGSEYALSEDRSSMTYGFAKWNGSTFAEAQPAVAPDVVVANNHLTVSIDRSDLDNTSSFNFYAASYDGSGINDQGHYDVAPDGTATYHYAYQVPLALSLSSAHAGVAKAGGSWSYSIGVRRADTGKNVGSEGTITCHATGGGKALPITSHEFASPGGGAGTTALCRLHVPAALKRKLLHGTITVRYGGLAVTHTFTVRAK